MLRLGLCCAFRSAPIKFKTTTAAAVGRLSRREGRAKLARLCADNAEALYAALQFCGDRGIGCFRVNSQILPLKTHPRLGYALSELPGGEAIVGRFRDCGELVRRLGLRTCLHPDQFVVLSSPRPDVVRSSLDEIEYQAEVAEWIGADVVNIHGGGAYGDKRAALDRFRQSLALLSDAARSRLTVENDDKVYTPADLLPLCRAAGIPLVYDVHHHRCLPDGLSVAEATQAALATWNREPLFHLSSPLAGWRGAGPERHHDFIALRDFPRGWLGLDATVEVEAKAKELAVLRLQQGLRRLARTSNAAGEQADDPLAEEGRDEQPQRQRRRSAQRRLRPAAADAP